jgi:hypothetical protein
MSQIGSDEELRTAVHEAVDDVTAGFDLMERVRRGVVRRRRRLQVAGSMAAVVTLATGVGVVSQRHDGGATVSAAGEKPVPGGRVTVTFQSSTFVNTPMPLVDGDVKAWVQYKIAAEGLKDVDVSARQSPFRLIVTGRAADLPQLKMLLGTPVVLQFREVTYVSTPPTLSGEKPRCKVSTTETSGAARMACDRHNDYTWVSSAAAPDYHVVDASAEPPAGQQGSGGWRLVVKLDPAGTTAFAKLTSRTGGSHLAVMVDGTVHDQWDVTKPIVDGVVTIDGGYTEQEARDLATKLSDQGPPGLDDVTVTANIR